MNITILDAAGNIDTLASFAIIDFVLTIDYYQVAMGNYVGAMNADVYLQPIADNTGILPVSSSIYSVSLTSDDAVIHIDGVSVLGPWEIYESSAHTFSPLNASSACP